MIFVEAVFVLWYAMAAVSTLHLALRPSTQRLTLESNLAFYRWVLSKPHRVGLWFVMSGLIIGLGQRYAELPVMEVYVVNLAIRLSVVSTAIQRGMVVVNR